MKQKKRILLILLIFVGIFNTINAQVDLLEFPSDKQLYARDLSTNMGNVIFQGTINNSTSYTIARVKVYRNNVLLTTLEEVLSYSGAIANFDMNYNLTAELVNYKFELYGVTGSTETLIESADEVVAGDAYIINGQSNAAAGARSGTGLNRSPFIRVFGSGTPEASEWDPNWHEGQGDDYGTGNAGQWGQLFAKHIVDNKNIPVAIFNGAHPGRPISHFARNDSNPLADNSYGRLLRRVRETKLEGSIRAIMWHQGESDIGNLSIEAYSNSWKNLYNDWKEDYANVEKVYIFQIRNGCTKPFDGAQLIKESQRQLASEFSDVEIMSTSGADHFTDDCHYYYENGYQLFGNWIYGLINQDLYNVTSSNVEAPSIVDATITATNEITLTMANPTDALTWVSGAEQYITVNNLSVPINSGVTVGNTVVLTFSQNISTVSTISYVGNEGGDADPMVVNQNGIAAVHFYEYPVSNGVIPPSCGVFNASVTIEAEAYCDQSGISTEVSSEGGQNITSIENGDWTKYDSVDFGVGVLSFEARVASNTSGGNIEIRLDSPTGTLIGTCTVNGTSGTQTWETVTASATGVSGIHDLYLVYTGGAGALFNVGWFKFSSQAIGPLVLLNATSGNGYVTLNWDIQNINADVIGLFRDTDDNPSGRQIVANYLSGTSYTDNSVTNETEYWYWLKVTEASTNFQNDTGAYALPSASLSIDLNSKSENLVKLYPNPVSDKITVNMPIGIFNEYRIVDISGRVNKVGTISIGVKEMDIDVSNLSKGIYLVSFTGNEVVKTLKVIKD